MSQTFSLERNATTTPQKDAGGAFLSFFLSSQLGVREETVWMEEEEEDGYTEERESHGILGCCWVGGEGGVRLVREEEEEG